jgi:thioredoxin-like negative regulator of GroEL
MMHPLPDQLLFEALLHKRVDERLPNVPERVIVWFSASWCGPCKRVDGQALLDTHPNVTFFKCDVDENEYSLGYCGLSSIPSFVAIQNGKYLGHLQNSATEKISQWISNVFQK